MQLLWGLNDQIKGVAERFAAAGFTALAPDLYGGRVTAVPDEANHLMEGLDWVGATEVEVRGALQYLKARLERAAVMGFCMGGALTVIAAAKLAELLQEGDRLFNDLQFVAGLSPFCACRALSPAACRRRSICRCCGRRSRARG